MKLFRITKTFNEFHMSMRDENKNDIFYHNQFVRIHVLGKVRLIITGNSHDEMEYQITFSKQRPKVKTYQGSFSLMNNLLNTLKKNPNCQKHRHV